MPAIFESDGPRTSTLVMATRGLCLLVVIVAVVTVMLVKSGGSFDETTQVTAVLGDVGDGLVANSDVKFIGVVVGVVSGVTRSAASPTNDIHIDLGPEFADRIPSTVTARVVPSNVFAVPSIQFVDNGAATPLNAGSVVTEDTTLETVRLQTTLTRAREIIAAAGRDNSDRTVGMLQTLEKATAGRGSEIADTASKLDRLVSELNTVTAPGPGPSTLESMSTAVSALSTSAPDLLDALHNSIVPLRTVAEQRTQLHDFLSGGLFSLGTVTTALENNTDKLITITTNVSAPLGVLADGAPHLSQMVRSLRNVDDRFADGFWNSDTQSATAKVVVSLTPHHQYTAADCPRYGGLAAPSCTGGPTSQPPAIPPPGMAPGTYSPPASLLPTVPIGGNVGPVGSPAEQQQIADVLGGLPSAAGSILFGPLARGNDVQLFPQEGAGQ